MLFNSAWQFHWSNNNVVIVNESKINTLGLKIDAEKFQGKKKEKNLFLYISNYNWLC